MFLRGQTRRSSGTQKQIELAAKEQRFEEAQDLKQEGIERLLHSQRKTSPDIALPRIQSIFGQQAVTLLSTVVRSFCPSA